MLMLWRSGHRLEVVFLPADDLSIGGAPSPTNANERLEALVDDGERVIRRERQHGSGGRRQGVLVVEHASSAGAERLAHEFALRSELDAAWAVRPLTLLRERGRTRLLLEDPGGEPLELLLGDPMEIGAFLRRAVEMADAVACMHRAELIHKDLKPANILMGDSVRLTGFGLASRASRERQRLGPPGTIAGTLAYMAPEQTGYINRSIDARSDLYALGVVFYRMLTGSLPFEATDAIGWAHCHIARRPLAPAEKTPGVPGTLSTIVLKLMSKAAEDRYQTASGLKSDLERCLSEWDARGRIDNFEPGAADTPDGLRLPEKLYGREREVRSLVGFLEAIGSGSNPKLVLIYGRSGVGKSALVRELCAASIATDGLFASGKCDPQSRDVPYAALVSALRGLMRHALAQTEAELTSCAAALSEALEPHGALLLPFVPELQLIVGNHPAAPEASPRDAQIRFARVLHRFLRVFAAADHPLTLFVDDLQWADEATLDLLRTLASDPDFPHLLLIGAFRDDEVDETHPLVQKIADVPAERIALGPLGFDGVIGFVSDALRCGPDVAAPLARVLHEKTDGNPFFLVQFMQSLVQERLLTFDHRRGGWRWDIDGVRSKSYADNVADLMAARLRTLPESGRNTLAELACLETGSDASTIGLALGASAQDIQANLREALSLDLIERGGGSYRFVHDRVREAAYAVTPEAQRPALHLQIGRRLLAGLPDARRDEMLFKIVSHLDRGASLMEAQDERDRLAELHLAAGLRAKAGGASAAALAQFIAGFELLADDCWRRRHGLAFALELGRAECEFLTGDVVAANDRLTQVAARAKDTVERAAAACLRIDVCVTLDRSDEAVAVGLEFLRHLGIDWPAHPERDQAQREYDRIRDVLGNRNVADLLDAPLMTDAASLATMDVLTKVLPPALFTDMNLLSLVVCRAANLSLERGNCDGSCVAYVQLGMIAGVLFDDQKTGFRFGDLGYRLVEHRGLRRFQAATYMLFGAHVLPWIRHVREATDVLRNSFDIANRSGDLTFAGYSLSNLGGNLLETGDPLDDVQIDVDQGLAVAKRMGFGFVAEIIAAQRGLVRTLRGLTATFGSFAEPEYEESRIARHFAANPNLWRAELIYWNLKMRALVVAGDWVAAVGALSKLTDRPWIPLTPREASSYHFFAGLSLAGFAGKGPPEPQHLEALKQHGRRLAFWAETCPENFADRAALIGAEVARLERRTDDAMILYERAIRAAGDNGFVQIEALAYETAARFYAGRGFEEFARLYRRNARDCYRRWGALGKARQMEDQFPYLLGSEQPAAQFGVIGTPVEQLDLATVLEVSEAVSGDIVLEKLIDTLLRTALQHAGARRGVLLLPEGAQLRQRAEANTGEDGIAVELGNDPLTDVDLPASLVRYGWRTQTLVILDDASSQGAFTADDYIRNRKSRSILCLPLVKQGKLLAMLYLENDFASHVFTPSRVAVLKFLASEAATSLDNARLYRAVQEREARIRRLVDANIIGIAIFSPDGRIVDANHSFLQQIGYDREDLEAGRLRWDELTPPEWSERNALAHEELRATGAFQPFEKEYFHKDGSRVPILAGAAAFDGEHAVGFVLDLSARKRAEAEIRESESRYREAQSELAHANRVAAVGQLTASIAHEVSQPLTAMATNAQAALRWLNRRTPDLDETRDALASISQDGVRASEVIARIRNLIKKKPPKREPLSIDAVLHEGIEITRAEAARKHVAVEMDFADGLPKVMGDRVELQQVAVNLILNAIEAMAAVPPEERIVSVMTARSDDGGVVVAVADTGPGLSTESYTRLFEPFYTTKPSGLGIGLSICRSIVEAHGGRLQAGSNTPRGAVFRFKLPRREHSVAP
jgi:PAS domain S-box-containing protein